jgi:2-oxoacid:acceptor oxidoreductase delta subunit (pyruvate/2-ketoisovalerate family)
MALKGWQEMPIGGMILEAGNSVGYVTGSWRAFRPVRGQAACTHCFQCWLFCPDSSILVNIEQEEMTGFDLMHCKGCGICAAVCPVNAKVARKLDEELARDDVRLCIYMVEEESCLE